jgi:hypothetical protein
VYLPGLSINPIRKAGGTYKMIRVTTNNTPECMTSIHKMQEQTLMADIVRQQETSIGIITWIKYWYLKASVRCNLPPFHIIP